MRFCMLLVISLLCSFSANSQELQWFGPRAGLGYLSASGSSDMKKGAHSAFGWQIELPYTSGDLTGYGEAGFTLLGIEQTTLYPNVWGYFGCRYKEFGGGIGPVINPVGTGLGLNMYYQIFTDKLRIPIGVDWNFLGGATRIQLFVGFNYK